MTERFQWQRVLDLFHAHGNVLHTSHFLDDVHLRNEWRARLTDLRNKGYRIEAFRVHGNPKIWVYRLTDKPYVQTEIGAAV